MYYTDKFTVTVKDETGAERLFDVTYLEEDSLTPTRFLVRPAAKYSVDKEDSVGFWHEGASLEETREVVGQLAKRKKFQNALLYEYRGKKEWTLFKLERNETNTDAGVGISFVAHLPSLLFEAKETSLLPKPFGVIRKYAHWTPTLVFIILVFLFEMWTSRFVNERGLREAFEQSRPFAGRLAWSLVFIGFLVPFVLWGWEKLLTKRAEGAVRQATMKL